MNNNEINIHISSATFFRGILLALLLVLLYVLRDIVLLILTSVVIASAVEPAARWFQRYKIPRVPAVLFVYVMIIATVALVFYLFVPPLFNEVSNLADVVPRYINSVNVLTPDVGSTRAEQFVGELSSTFSIESAIQSVRQAIAGISGSVFGTVSAIFGGVFGFFLVVILSFYLAVQENGIENFLRMIIPLKHEAYAIDLWRRSQEKIGKWMQGQLLLGIFIGILVYLGLTVLGIKYALMLALLAALAELIPVFGPIIAAVPAAMIGFLDSLTLGFSVIALYIIIQQFENHLIYPLVVRKVVGVPPIIVILGLIIGGKIAGFIGILLSVPVAAVLLEFMNDFQKSKRQESTL